jgi:hypothetical protein
VGSNGSVSVGTFSKIFGGLVGGGDLNTPANAGGSMHMDGPTTFNGNVYYGSFVNLYGPVNAGQDAFLAAAWSRTATLRLVENSTHRSAPSRATSAPVSMPG